MKAWKICEEELQKLLDNNQLTFNYCNRFSYVFVFDGKYFNVATYKYDWVLLWGVDYFRHDIPIFTIAPSESYQSWSKFFFYFRLLNQHPKLVVCDDNYNLKLATRKHFPITKIQNYYNHFKQKIRLSLKVRSDKTYRPFMREIEKILSSSQKVSDNVFNKWMFNLYLKYKNDPVCLSAMINIERYKNELLAYRNIHQAPLTTNIIEGLILILKHD